jgi:tetratricopeptide (TPR) repeat protein
MSRLGSPAKLELVYFQRSFRVCRSHPALHDGGTPAEVFDTRYKPGSNTLKTSASLAVFVVIASLATLSAPPSSSAPQAAASEQTTAASNSASDYEAALSFWAEYVSRRPELWWKTGTHRERATIQSFKVSGDVITLSLSDRDPLDLKLRDLPFVGVERLLGPPIVCVYYRTVMGTPCVMGAYHFVGVEDTDRFISAWKALAAGRPVIDPATDNEFLTALQRVRSDPADHTEDWHRVRVQAKALVAAERVGEAADVFRAALVTYPQWADGHFNLALMAAELGQYSEAITEMKRYVYLAPNAPDARAAQDKIYQWEALGAPPPR